MNARQFVMVISNHPQETILDDSIERKSITLRHLSVLHQNVKEDIELGRLCKYKKLRSIIVHSGEHSFLSTEENSSHYQLVPRKYVSVAFIKGKNEAP